MNIKSLCLLGILSISSGICGDNPANNMIGSNNGNGVINASNNLIGVAPQENHVANVNNIQGNNLGQQNAIDLPNGTALTNANDAPNIRRLRSICDMLDEMTTRSDGVLRLVTAIEILRLSQNNANNTQYLQPELFLVGTALCAVTAPNAEERLNEVFTVLQGVQRIFDSPNPMQLLTQLWQHLNNTQPWQHSNNSSLVQRSNNVSDNNYEQQCMVLNLIRATLRDMCSASNRTIRMAIVREYLPAIGNPPDIANNAQQISMELSVAEIIQNIIRRPDATANLWNVLLFLLLVQHNCDNPLYAGVFWQSLSFDNANNAQRLRGLRRALDNIQRVQMLLSILCNALRSANNAQHSLLFHL